MASALGMQGFLTAAAGATPVGMEAPAVVHKKHGGATVLAMGVVVTRSIPAFRRRSSWSLGVSWRYVTTDRSRESDPLFAVVDCPDVFFNNATAYGGNKPGQKKIVMGFQFSCFCKTVSWFRRALELEPSARFIGKMEDDSVLHDARVVAELTHAYRLVRREIASVTHMRQQPLLWYGHFAWTLFQGRGRAKFCGDLDDHLLSPTPRVCARASPSSVLAPFASGGLDIRSRGLVETTASCEELWRFVSGYDPTNASYYVSCDGEQGYYLARCLALETRALRDNGADAPTAGKNTHAATLLHLPWPKFHVPSRRFGARLHSSLLHPHRGCTFSGDPSRRKADACDPSTHLQNSWRWNLGLALLPFRFQLHGARRQSSGVPTLWAVAHNRSLLKTYHRLHLHREDDRYCDVLPCAFAARPPADTRYNGTVLPCTSMVECVDGEGGRYFYRGSRGAGGDRARTISASATGRKYHQLQ